jgi:hypothetical protein
MYQQLQNRNMPTRVLSVAYSRAAPFTISNWQHLVRKVSCEVKNLVISQKKFCAFMSPVMQMASGKALGKSIS